jgi:hypothetical protein
MGDVHTVYTVEPIDDRTQVTWWAAMAVVINYRDGSRLTADEVFDMTGQDPALAQSWDAVTNGALAHRLDHSNSPRLDVEGWNSLLNRVGPIWLCHEYGDHAAVLNGVEGDGTANDSTFYITDPWDGQTTVSVRGLPAVFDKLGTMQPGDRLFLWHK